MTRLRESSSDLRALAPHDDFGVLTRADANRYGARCRCRQRATSEERNLSCGTVADQPAKTLEAMRTSVARSFETTTGGDPDARAVAVVYDANRVKS